MDGQIKRFFKPLSALLLLGILLFAFNSCFPREPSSEEVERFSVNLQKVSKGMNKQQVKALLGQEHNFFTFTAGKRMEELDVWMYTPKRSGRAVGVVFDKNDHVEQIRFPVDADGACGASTWKTLLCDMLY
jgi:outer membrane protein assembly factor BamE (lipoprotein component of BamABCDE complex)